MLLKIPKGNGFSGGRYGRREGKRGFKRQKNEKLQRKEEGARDGGRRRAFDSRSVFCRTPVIATSTVVAVFTAICLFSGIVAYQLARHTVQNANLVKEFSTVDDAIDFLQKSGLEDKYAVTVHSNNNGQDEFRITADFTPKSGEYDLDDFDKYKNVEVNGNVVTVTAKAYNLEYNGEKFVYYVLNERYLNAKIEVKDGAINVVDSGQALGNAIGAIFVIVAQLAINIVVYSVGIIAAIVPSEIYFEKLIRNEAKKCDEAK